MQFLIFFYIFLFLSFTCVLIMIISKNMMYVLIAKILAFIFTSIIWLSLYKEYLSLLLILVYVGAVLVMFIFVSIILDMSHNYLDKNKKISKNWIYLTISSLCSMILIIYSLNLYFENKQIIPVYTNIKDLGYEIFSYKYIYAFDLIAMLMLSGMIVSISIIKMININNKISNK